MGKTRKPVQRKTAKRAAAKAGPARKIAKNGLAAPEPVKLKGKRAIEPESDGPVGWFLPQAEATYANLQSRDAPPPAAPVASARALSFASTFQPGKGEEVLVKAKPTIWRDSLAEYKRRKAAHIAKQRAAMAPGAPAIPGAVNWLPLGPKMVLHGQTVGEESIGGRVAGIAIAPGGSIIFAASANGGVFRSDDAGNSWKSLMDGFDVDPTDFASTSLACGTIAIDPADPQRVYVGTGEGDTNQMFQSRIINALPAYRGIGPIRSDDGGANWATEPAASGSPALDGQAFFALAIDPANRDNVVAATTTGLYQRVPKSGGKFEWTQRRPNVHCSAVVASAGSTTRFFAAEWGQRVVYSKDGKSWSTAGTGFPTTGVGRIALGVQPTKPDLVYAFVANTQGAVLGVYRLDSVTAAWKKIANPPDVLPTDDNGGSQGDYDMAIAVSPADANLIYLAGSYANVDPYPGSIWRCSIVAAGQGYKVGSSASIGTHAHADVHCLAFTPADANELWCGCDGGVFLNRNPTGTGEFASQNSGLACLCSNFLAMHPTDPGILFTGLQDNGTAMTTGSPSWNHVNYGDGGYCLIHWANPKQVLSYVNGVFYRATDGGLTHDSWTPTWQFGWATMTQPLVGAPYNPSNTGDADWVAVGAGEIVYISKDFASTWPTGMRITLPGNPGSVFALAFATTARLYIATTAGQVYRADRTGNNWTTIRLDNAAAGPLGLTGMISDIAVDWKDANLNSVYVAFGGMGDWRRVWRYDGTKWEPRSGQVGSSQLLDVEHNALAVDRTAPDHIYVGADIGVWHSPDGGKNWQPFQNGLPDAPAYDLQIHATQRLLRAALHGRGVYEISLS